MEKMVNVYLFGKRYQVPESLTIMKAMEYAGYQLVRGCGCRNGFCGACATIYRIHGQQELKSCLACQQQVEEGMYVATLPFFPLVKQVYDINKIKAGDLLNALDADGNELIKTGDETAWKHFCGERNEAHLNTFKEQPLHTLFATTDVASPMSQQE